MELKFKPTAIRDLDYWNETENQKILNRIGELIKSTLDTPFSGIGKPETLKHALSGLWSLRIDRKNRIVYTVERHDIFIISCKGHYE